MGIETAAMHSIKQIEKQATTCIFDENTYVSFKIKTFHNTKFLCVCTILNYYNYLQLPSVVMKQNHTINTCDITNHNTLCNFIKDTTWHVLLAAIDHCTVKGGWTQQSCYLCSN